MQNARALWETAQQFCKVLSYHVDQQFHSEGHTQENWKQTRRHKHLYRVFTASFMIAKDVQTDRQVWYIPTTENNSAVERSDIPKDATTQGPSTTFC